jgi:DNA-binding transcriptional ArsR family regulator
MAGVLDLTGRRPGFRLRLETGTAYELLVSLCAFCHGSRDVATIEDGPARHRAARRRASPQLLRALQQLGPRAGKAWVNLLGVAARRPPARLVPGLLERVDGMDPVEIRFTLLGGHVPAYQRGAGREVIDRAARGDRAAVDALFDDRSYFSGECRTLGPLLELSPRRTATLVREALHRWYDDVFSSWEKAAGEALAAESEASRPVLASEPPQRAIERITSVELVADSSIEEVVLIPHVGMRPWLLLCEYDSTRLFCFPAGRSAETSTNHRDKVLALARALSDPKRVQMLEAIGEEGARVPELSARFSLPTSTTYHHLAILRAAGLVRVRSDVDRRYSVRSDAFEELRDSLLTLTGSPATEPTTTEGGAG